jgi:hypothetical protein
VYGRGGFEGLRQKGACTLAEKINRLIFNRKNACGIIPFSWFSLGDGGALWLDRTVGGSEVPETGAKREREREREKT